MSGGGEHGGRVLESVHERLEQKNDEQMNQNVRSGGTFVETWRPFEADQALQAFEAQFDAPSQTIEVEDIFRREGVGWEGGQQNEPVGGLKGSFGNLITFPLSIPFGTGAALPGPSRPPGVDSLLVRVRTDEGHEGWGEAFARAVYHANFAADRDIAAVDVIAAIIGTLGREPTAILQRGRSDDTKARLRAQSEEAIRRGIFGAPSFVVGDELFWGNDRLEQALAWALSPPHLPALV